VMVRGRMNAYNVLVMEIPVVKATFIGYNWAYLIRSNEHEKIPA